MGTRKTKKRKRKPQNNLLVLKLLILVVIVLVVFEGRLIHTMFSQRSSSINTISNAPKDSREKESEDAIDSDGEPSASSGSGTGSSVADQPMAGLFTNTGGSSSSEQTEADTVDPYRVSEELDSPAVVPRQSTSVDDSYFTDAVFIGDSRMEGFRNSSGITQGTFLTSIGLNSSGMSEASIASADGTISVYQGLSGIQYQKIYLMLGTNDLGYYPWEDFTPNFKQVIEQFHKLQSGAIIYICSVIYVDESKVSASYNNNENVRKINGYLLEICEEYDYCYYLNLNEIFTNGYGALLSDASSDGIHLYANYCAQMLDYLKSHYVSFSSDAAGEDQETVETAGSEESEEDDAEGDEDVAEIEILS